MATTRTGVAPENRGRLVPARWWARYRLVPWWGKVGLIWVLSRLVTTALVLVL
ncbi:MAG: hypothetical protein JWP54_25, partial [Cryobacterium sp.]|nr:hypothetical protein [Cryobacterium sp.]